MTDRTSATSTEMELEVAREGAAEARRTTGREEEGKEREEAKTGIKSPIQPRCHMNSMESTLIVID